MAYTLLTSTDQNFSGDLVRNLVSVRLLGFLHLIGKEGDKKAFKVT